MLALKTILLFVAALDLATLFVDASRFSAWKARSSRNQTDDKCESVISLSKETVSFFGFTCDTDAPNDPKIPAEIFEHNTEFAVADLSFNTYTKIPYEQICRFVNLFNLEMNHNKLTSLEQVLVNLKCLSELIDLDLSYNKISTNLTNPNDFDDRLCQQLEELDLGYNEIEYLDPRIFFRLDDAQQPNASSSSFAANLNRATHRFSNLNYLNLNGNKFKQFDLLLPLTFPNAEFYFDFSNNPVEKFVNSFRLTFKNSLFRFDFAFSNRTVYARNFPIAKLDDATFVSYGVQDRHDLELFLRKMLNYDFYQKSKSLKCDCPTISSNMVVWFKQLETLKANKSFNLFHLECKNITDPSVIALPDEAEANNGVFALNYDCGVSLSKNL